MNNIRLFSLLSKNESDKYFSVNDNTANDLSLDFLTQNISKDKFEQKIIKDILLKIPVDCSTIKYRQDIYKDLKKAPEICMQLYEIFDEMKFYSSEKIKPTDKKSSIWELVNRLKELENYSCSIIKIKEILDNHSFQSDGMKKFSYFIEEIYSNSGFHELSEDIKKLGYDISSIKSMTLGVNFNSEFYPEEVGIISMNEYYFQEESLLEKFIGFHKKRNDDKDLIPFNMTTHSHKANISENPLMNNLTSIVERMLPNITAKLKRILKKYTDTSGTALSKLADEFLFYTRFIELEQKLSDLNIPCNIADFSDDDTIIEDFYNIKLAICHLNGTIESKIVTNTLKFAKSHNIIILTGANRGGKTIFTQGIGLAFLMFQHGLFTPCSFGKIKICDGIYTHFPADENQTVSLGRLGEEAERFSRICKTATSESLLLFNESFATTSHTESLYIAKDIIKYLCCLGSRTCFNTHMHELAENIDTLNENNNAVCIAVSAVMETQNGERSYKIKYGKPDVQSYAHDIAYKYGITFEQLCKNI